MAEQIELIDVPLSEELQEYLTAQAQRRGFDRVGAYLLDLVEQDALAEQVAAPFTDDSEDEDIDVLAGLRRALQDVKAGRVHPYEKLREMIDE